jgi:hypothetical protein
MSIQLPGSPLSGRSTRSRAGYVGKRFATAQELLAAVASMRVAAICDIPVNVPVLGYVLSGREKRRLHDLGC